MDSITKQNVDKSNRTRRGHPPWEGTARPGNNSAVYVKKKGRDGRARRNRDGKRVQLSPLVIGISLRRVCESVCAQAMPGTAVSSGGTHHEFYNHIAMGQFVVGVDDCGHHRYSKVEVAGQHF